MKGMVKAPIGGERMTVDWARRVVEELRASRILPGVGYRVSYSRNGTHLVFDPSHKLEEIVESSTLEPFTVRYHITDKDQDGQLEVYMPYGCMTTTDTCVALNEKANKKSGHENDSKDWYAIPWDFAESKIRLYVMPGRHMIALCEPVSQEDAQNSEVAKYKDGARVIYYLKDIKTEKNEEGKTTVVLSGENLGAKTNTLTDRFPDSICKMEYTLYDVSYKVMVGKVMVTNNVFNLGAKGISAEDKEVPIDAKSIWMKINHSDDNYTMSMEFDPVNTEDTDDVTWYHVYDLKNRYVTADYRYSINHLVFLD